MLQSVNTRKPIVVNIKHALFIKLDVVYEAMTKLITALTMTIHAYKNVVLPHTFVCCYTLVSAKIANTS